MLKKISLFIKSLVLCLFLSVGAAHASAPVNVSSIGMAVVNGISDVAIAFVDDSMQARGFRGFGRANKGFSMNFGGKGKSAANTNATKNNTATQSNAAKGAATGAQTRLPASASQQAGRASRSSTRACLSSVCEKPREGPSVCCMDGWCCKLVALSLLLLGF